MFNVGLVSSQYVMPLDLITSPTASGAYGVRKLRTSYAGSCLRIRRSSDNSEQDIGFINDYIDTASLLSFVGAGNGFVSIWYDQSGSGLNLTQAVTSNQPRLVNAGSLYTQNNKALISFFGTNFTNYNSLALAAAKTTTATVAGVIYLPGAGFFLGGTSTVNWHSTPPTTLISSSFASASVKNGTAFYNNTSYAPADTPYPASLSTVTFNPQTPDSGTNWDNIGRDRAIFGSKHTSNGGGYCELIVFDTALTESQISILNSNQIQFYNTL